MTILELVTFSPSDSYRSDPEPPYKAAVSVLRKTEGVEGNHIYHGIRVENPSLAQSVLPWTSIEAHEAFVASPEYKGLMPKILPTINPEKASETFIQHVIFDDSIDTLRSLLSSPICDFGYLRAKSKEVLDDAKSKAIALTEAVQSPGYHGLVIGTLLEEQHTLLLIGGWDSLETHIAAIGVEAVKEKTAALLATDSTIEVFHVKLQATAFDVQSNL